MWKRILINGMFVILIVISLGLIFNKQIVNYLIKSYEPQVTKTKVKKASERAKKSDYNWKDVNSLTPTDVLKARLHSDKMNYVGYVAIPEIKLDLPISLGVSNDNLALGAGTLYQDQKMGEGNYSLASHFFRGSGNKDLLFSPIYYRGKVGQTIYLTDLSKVYTYTATSVKVVKSTDIAVTNPVAGKKLITLITCNYAHQYGRVVMQGELTKVENWADISSTVKHDISGTDGRSH